MKLRRTKLVCFLLILILLLGSCSRNTITHFPEYFKELRNNPRHETTEWNISSSMKFDALCFINTLTGDPFYLPYHREEYDYFVNDIDAETRASLESLRKFKDEIQFPLANLLVGYAFVMEEDKSLDDLIQSFENPQEMHRRYLSYSYNSQESIESHFKPIQQDVIVVLRFLKERGFEEYWSENIKPDTERRIGEIKQKTADFNIVPQLEKYLGYGLPSNKINIYVLGLTQPTAFHFGYDNFITDEVWPAENIYIASIHEPMHPSIDMNDFDIADVILEIRDDPFVAKAFEARDTSYGYNNIYLYIEENIIQALDRQIAKKMNVESRTLREWITKDEGMHVVGMAIYELMDREKFISGDEPIGDFLVRMYKRGKLKSGKIEILYNEFCKKDEQ